MLIGFMCIITMLSLQVGLTQSELESKDLIIQNNTVDRIFDNTNGIIYVSPESNAAYVGDTFEVKIMVDSITDPAADEHPEDKGACVIAFDMRWNPEVLCYVSVEKGTFLDIPGASTVLLIGDVDSVSGYMTDVTYGMLPGKPGALGGGLAFEVKFKVVGSGTSVLDMTSAEWYSFSPTAYVFTRMGDGYFSTPTSIETQSPNSLINKSSIALKSYPNPFNHKTVIRVQGLGISERQTINLQIYDLVGRLVKSFPITQQLNNSITQLWDGATDNGNRLPSGVYFCKLEMGKKSITNQILLLR
ncbi:MAG: T9SS type A sorting domain-containing protein [bacterium]|nr:T9SS type A sorting domain-containing protein [bacterium]